jgi:hypothetical protein
MTCLLEVVSRRARWTRQDNGFQTFFTSTGSTAAGRAVGVNDDNVTKLTGVVSGGIRGRHATSARLQRPRGVPTTPPLQIPTISPCPHDEACPKLLGDRQIRTRLAE